MDPELNPTTAGNSLMYQAIEEDNLEDLILLLENGMDVNEPIITTGEFAGFTALHFACMKNKNHLVELLVDYYKADVNATAADGTQPIHLACFYTQGYFFTPEEKLGIEKIKTLVKANANVDAEFGQEIFSKHVKYGKWCPDFGDKMPLVAYAVIYSKPSIIKHLKKVNLDIISLTNKTLLMYAAEDKSYHYISEIMSNVEDPKLRDKLINHRDNNDVPLTHYLFYPKELERFRYHTVCTINVGSVNSHSRFISTVASLGADMYALINNDAATFLPNLAAYRGCDMLLKDLLPYYTSMSLSRVLFYTTLSVDEEFENFMSSAAYRDFCLQYVRGKQKNCIDIALKDLVFRGVFRLPVPKEEIKLMDKLIASDENLSILVDNFKTNFIEKELQELFFEFGDNKMTWYDFFMQVFDDKKLKFLAQEENLLDSLDKVGRQNNDVSRFYEAYHLPIKTRIKDAKEKLRLLENLKKISTLKEAIPLPFELILDIVEYLNKKHLNVFIKAFYTS